jgi:hypothetical protein
VFLLVGLVLVVVGSIGFRNNRRLFRDDQRTTAEVVELLWVRLGRATPVARPGRIVIKADSNSSGSYYPVVSFRAADGHMVRARTRTGRIPAPARVGEQVRVIYNPGDPRIVAIDSLSGRGTMLCGLAVIVGVGAIAYQIFEMVR